ncbi:MAG: hypothetical protein J5I99_04900 [Verrucomicrobia bacterium]|nr:hypothetical protein [Verrucomicrobiota bacterium]
MKTSAFQRGDCAGEVAAAVESPAFVEWLSGIAGHLSACDSAGGQGGTRIYSVDVPVESRVLPLLIKAQGRLSLLKNLDARRRGTAQARAWRTACHLATQGVGTPEPLAWVERWNGGRCEESYFIARRLEPVTNFRDELRHLLWSDPDAGRVMELLAAIAPAVRAMHEAGVQHGDLGNQNILLQRDAAGRWGGVYFIDLNRARVKAEPLSLRARAHDLARLYLPTDLLRIFCEMYFGARAPAAFVSALRASRRRFRFHSWSRQIRHPIRQAQVRRDPERHQLYPPPREIWLWDEKSAQPINAWARRERKRLYPFANHWTVVQATLRAAPRIFREYSSVMASAFAHPVSMAQRWGMSVEPRVDTWERERALLPSAIRVPLLIRLYHHKGPEQWSFAMQAGRSLAEAGHRVGFALCQDRRAIVDRVSWAAMCERAVANVADFADWIEAGHAINRVKWGLWDLRDYRVLLEPIAKLREIYPGLKWMGPGGIDFEYPHVLGALSGVSKGFQFHALSHHLYVDRRGAPEQRQGRFAALEKFALARAMARASGRCEDRLIVSEVNWPLANTGIYSPVCSPYLYPGQIVGAPNVSETDYARFMIRYLLQAACSGLVERVYWWRLASHGFGLVDEGAEPWRMRPAYRAWLRLLDVVGEATFWRNVPLGGAAYLHLFRRVDGEVVGVGYSWGGPSELGSTFACSRAEAMDGAVLDAVPRQLTSDPVYFRSVSV